MWRAPFYRKSYKKKYGSKCFLEPKRLKYPVCSKGKISCKGLLAAANYARLNKKRNITKKIRQLRTRYC